MTDLTISPVYAIRDYTWAVLKANDPTVWSESKYGGKIPITPVNEEPEIAQYDGPFIVYDFTLQDSGSQYYRRRGNVVFSVFDTQFRRGTRTLNIIDAAFSRMDDSAADIQKWISDKPKYGGLGFNWTSVNFVGGLLPEDEEGGSQRATIGINFEYIIHHNVITIP